MLKGVKKRYVTLLAVLLLILVAFFFYWRSLDYALYTTVCDPSTPNDECYGHNVAVAFVLTSALKLNYWGALGTAIATGVIAWFTLSLRDVGREQGIIATRANWHFRVTERAYLKVSHITPDTGPALTWSPNLDVFGVEVEIKNLGRTPARVTDSTFNYQVFERGEWFTHTPAYIRQPNSADETHAFLVCKDRFIDRNRCQIDPEVAKRVLNETAILIFFGYVDYRDQFGQRHRRGYGRQYGPGGLGNNNLVYPAGGLDGLNYDRPRVRGEGKDWDDE